jgi:hypothetical protein
VNPLELNEPSSRWVNIWPLASGPKNRIRHEVGVVLNGSGERRRT